jgi:hypothetical protein
MFEILLTIVLGFLAIILWALMGHGLWTVVRSIFSAVVGRGCPTCGRTLYSKICPHCSQQPSQHGQPVPSVDEDLKAAERLIKYSRFKGWLDETQLASVTQLLKRLTEHVSDEASPEVRDEEAIEEVLIESEEAEAPPIDALASTRTQVATTPIHPLDQSYTADKQSSQADGEPDLPARSRGPVSQRLTTSLLKSFMEQSNIRWIELISATLIVVCSVGLVISLWSTLSSTSRFFPSLVFLLATAAVHGAGQYTLRQWKLRSTSRGILHIGLMLIPLAVLVGILLARREGELPRLDGMAIGTIAIGTLVYGSLAITASRALFPRRWPIVSLASIAASLTLLPIHFAAEHQQLNGWWSWLLPLPIVLITQWSALSASLTSLRRGQLHPRIARRMVGMIVQTCFVASVVSIFWALEARQTGGLSVAWWVMLAAVSSAWIGWSLSLWQGRGVEFDGQESDAERRATLKKFDRQDSGAERRGALKSYVRQDSDTERRGTLVSPLNSGLLVAGWGWGSVCLMLLLAAVWQTSNMRGSLTGLLFIVGLWWLVHGRVCQLRSSLTAACLTLIISCTLGIEGGLNYAGVLTVRDSQTPSEILRWVDWLSCSRTMIMTALGLMCIGMGSWWMQRARTTRSAGHTLSEFGQPLLIAGIGSIAISAMLTLSASLSPLGSSPYGGNWAPLMLAVYGLLSSVAAIYIVPLSIAPNLNGRNPIASGLMPIGLALLLLAIVRLCQTSPLLANIMIDLRPHRAWGIGLVGLATIWSLAAAALRTGWPAGSTDQRTNVNWLAGGALAASIASLPAVWQLPEHFALASKLGWTLPLICLALLIAWRHTAWREIALLALCIWLSTVVLNLGDWRGWWPPLGGSGRIAPFVASIVAAVFIFEIIVQAAQRSKRRPEQASESAAATTTPQTSPVWWAVRPHWGASVCIAISWLLLFQANFAPVASNLSRSLGIQAHTWAAANGYVAPSNSVVVLVLACGISLAAVACWLGCVRRQWWLVSAVALLPIFTATVAAAAIAPPFALAAGLWVLACWILLSELLPLLGKRTAQLSHVAWQQTIAIRTVNTATVLWLPLSRALAGVLLLVGSGAYLLGALGQQLPLGVSFVSGASWQSNIWNVSLTLAPVFLVSLARWGVSVVSGQSSNMISLSGGLTALSAAALVTVSLPPAWPNSAIVFLQISALVATMLAWMTILWVGLRNFIGLRKLTRGQTPARQLLPKSMKGQRWKQAELASWSLVSTAFLSVVVICLSAAVLVIAYPASVLPGLEKIGGWFGGIVLALTLTLFCWLANRRGAPGFGLLAIVLGLAAPLIAATYASHLIAFPQDRFPGAADFEPYRLLLVLWLLALAIGFLVRLLAMRVASTPDQSAKSMSAQLGEGAWILLAWVIGSLALVSTWQDPNPLLPFIELSGLALVGVLSSVATGQSWRGHLAAFAAAAGLYGWLESSAIHHMEALWGVLWGPVWVAGVALIFRFSLGQRLASLWSVDLSESLQDTNRRGASSHFKSLWTVDLSESLQDTNRRGASSHFKSQWTVDQSVSVHVPVASAALSLVWILSRAPQVPTALPWAIVALSATSLALACARLWDTRPGKRGLSVYLNLWSKSLVGSIAFSAWAELPWLHTSLLWMASGLGAMALMAGLLRELVREASNLTPALRLGEIASPQQLRHALTWMPSLHAAMGLLALLPSALLVLSLEERTLRIAATVLPFIGACAILPIAIERGRLFYRYCGLLLISSTLVLLWWADLPQAWGAAGPVASWLYVQRLFAALVVLGGAVYPLTVLLFRKPTEWERPLMASGWVALGLGTACGLVLLAVQLDDHWRALAVAASLGTKLLSLSAWMIVIVRLLQFAARPHSLDRRLSIGVRQAAVYAAQIALAVLCAVAFIHFPKLFSGVLAAWWPIVLFAIAMLSAALGEWLYRAGEKVIADPVQRSSLLLPIIPLAGVWWIEPDNLPWLWRDWDRYWLLLLTAAGLYGLHGWLRRSLELRALSGILLLASFWTFLHSQPNLRFMEHPQFWLLPPALATLAFVEFNRRRLDAGVLLAARYGAILIAYLSSTSEILLDAFDGQLWQPLLLLGLALGGVIVGIAIQVRAFLYCGVAFTVVALLAMVWHAQQAIGQVWPWWAFGIATGIGLIVLLGYFEKNRPRVIAYLEKLKQWD